MKTNCELNSRPTYVINHVNGKEVYDGIVNLFANSLHLIFVMNVSTNIICIHTWICLSSFVVSGYHDVACY